MVRKIIPILIFALLAGAPSRAQFQIRRGLHSIQVPDGSLSAQELQEQREAAQEKEEEGQEREQEARDREQERKDREVEQKERANDLYEEGKEALDEHRWETAMAKFDAAAGERGANADGALYWKAYAQNKLGRRADALATLADMQKSYPKSRWLGDARALEAEVRQSSGQRVSPENESDEDLKLMAIDSLMNSDPERALPLLKGVLDGPKPVKLKERALFVLSQSGSPKSHEVLGQIARGNSNPDLQRKALDYLGISGSDENRKLLADIYASSNEPEVKRTILHGFMVSGDHTRLLAVATGEKDPDLRIDAVHQLGVMGAQNELWDLYQKESSLEVKKAILQGMFVGGGAERLGELAKSEKNPELRREAVRDLGLIGESRSGELLVSIYQNDKDTSIRREVLQALFIQGNAKAIIQIARKETDPDLKKRAVRNLSLMDSKEATDFMMELLNK